MIDKALDVLDAIDRWTRSIRTINASIKALDPIDDFPATLQVMPEALEVKVVNLLDNILADIASYYLYEVSGMKDGGSITDNGVEYKIRNIDDVRRYVESVKAS